MSKTTCRRCLWIRALILAMLLGAAAGWLSIHYGAGRQLSMLATFVAAVLPLLWYARSTRKS